MFLSQVLKGMVIFSCASCWKCSQFVWRMSGSPDPILLSTTYIFFLPVLFYVPCVVFNIHPLHPSSLSLSLSDGSLRSFTSKDVFVRLFCLQRCGLRQTGAWKCPASLIHWTVRLIKTAEDLARPHQAMSPDASAYPRSDRVHNPIKHWSLDLWRGVINIFGKICLVILYNTKKSVISHNQYILIAFWKTYWFLTLM